MTDHETSDSRPFALPAHLPFVVTARGAAGLRETARRLAAQLEDAERWMDKRPPEIAAAAAA